jgi:hypothetical protein
MEGEWSASRPDRFAPGESATCTQWIGGWTGPRAGLDAAANGNEIPSFPLPGIEPHRPARSLVTMDLGWGVSVWIGVNSLTIGEFLDQVTNYTFSYDNQVVQWNLVTHFIG